jgi:hypothetical protein
MKSLHLGATVLLAALTAPCVAQPGPPASGPGMGMDRCAAGAASAADGNCPAGPRGPHHRMARGPGRADTPGWSLMSAEERRAHADKMRSMKDYESCKAYLDQHHEGMKTRATQLGQPQPPQPRRDACAPLKRAKP